MSPRLECFETLHILNLSPRHSINYAIRFNSITKLTLLWILRVSFRETFSIPFSLRALSIRLARDDSELTYCMMNYVTKHHTRGKRLSIPSRGKFISHLCINLRYRGKNSASWRCRRRLSSTNELITHAR